MKHLSISLSPSGSFVLHLPDNHSVIVPVSEAGARILAANIRDWTEAARIGERGNPTQHNINEALKGAVFAAPLQLAGRRKRWAETKAATGVTVRAAKPPKRPLSLADLGL